MHSFDKSFKNYFCDAISCSLGEFFDVFDEFSEEQILTLLNNDELNALCEFAVIKNKKAGVGELYLKVPFPSFGRNALDKYHIDGKEILSARQMGNLTTGDFVGERVMLYVEDLLDYKEGALSELSDFLAKAEMPVIISLGRTLEEVGKVVNRYGKSPVEILEDFGFLDRNCYVYDLNFIDKEDQKLLSSYDTTLIFSPRSDGEEGKGAINLYNFIYNRLKFVFSSGKCYNIDMLGEGKLASINTNNLMYERGLVKTSDLLDALLVEKAEKDYENINIFDERVDIEDERLNIDYLNLREKVIEIAKRIKEKI